MKEVAMYRANGRSGGGLYGSRTLYVVTTGMVYGNENDRLYPSDAYVDDKQPGVIRWASNDRCVPMDICERMDWENLDAQRAADEADTARLIADYRRQQAAFEADTSPEAMAAKAERDFERRAAFGEGVEVVDVLSGRRYRT